MSSETLQRLEMAELRLAHALGALSRFRMRLPHGEASALDRHVDALGATVRELSIVTAVLLANSEFEVEREGHGRGFHPGAAVAGE